MPTGGTGEVVVRGEMVMREYWKQPDLPASILCARTENWRYRLPGYRWLSVSAGPARRHDQCRWTKVAPDEIEALLCQLEGVRDAGCIAEPDELVGECVKAYLVADREIGRARSGGVSAAAVRGIQNPEERRANPGIPRTISGKIQRQMLRNPVRWRFDDLER